MRQRTIVYIYAENSPDQERRSLPAQASAQFKEQAGSLPVEVVIDKGPLTRRRTQSRVLARLAKGEADRLLIVGTVTYEINAAADRFLPLLAGLPAKWLSRGDLERAGLLAASGKGRGHTGRRRAHTAASAPAEP